MRRLVLFGLFAVLTAGGTLILAPAPTRVPPSCKPVAPIDLTAEIVGDPSAPFSVTARAASRNGGEVELEILVPEGITHVGGERKMKAKRADATIDLVAKDRGRREILVRATIQEGTAKMVKVVSLMIFDGPPAPRPGKPGRNAAGEAILEFSP